MEKVEEFKAGDIVPQWVEETNNALVTFTTDVEVYKHDGFVHVFPKVEMDSSVGIMFSKRVNEEAESFVKGAPTHLHTYPYGHEKNHIILV